MVKRGFCLFLTILLITVPFISAHGQEKNYKVGTKQLHDYPQVPRISAYAAKYLFDQGKLILVNTHVADAQKKNMLLGAVGAPEGRINGRDIRIPRNIIVAFYCA